MVATDLARRASGTDGRLLTPTEVLLQFRADCIRAVVWLQRTHEALDNGDQGIDSHHRNGQNGHQSQSRDVISAGQPG